MLNFTKENVGESNPIDQHFLFLAACMVLHNIILMLQEGPPTLPPNLAEPTFQELLRRCQIQVLPEGRPAQGNFETRNTIIGRYF